MFTKNLSSFLYLDLGQDILEFSITWSVVTSEKKKKYFLTRVIGTARDRSEREETHILIIEKI